VHREPAAVGPAEAAAVAAVGSPIPGAPTGAGVIEDGDHESDKQSLPDDEDREDEAMAGGSGASASAATSETALSTPASPHYGGRPASAFPLLHPHAHHPKQPHMQMQPPPSQRQTGQAALRKDISSHIAGTGTFMVMYDQPPLTGEFDRLLPTRDSIDGVGQLMIGSIGQIDRLALETISRSLIDRSIDQALRYSS
jgi:hypothetical protein